MMQPRPRRSVDGFIQRPIGVKARRPVRVRPQPPILPSLPAPRVYAKPLRASPPKRRLPSWLEMPLIILLAMTGGILAQSVVFGQLAIVAYGAIAFIWRIPSRITFTLALVALAATIVLLVGRGNIPLSQNFATYTFLLLVAGVIGLGRELKKEGGRVYSIRERNINNW